MQGSDELQLSMIADIIEIETHIDALAEESRLPALSVGACLLSFDKAAPLLRAPLVQAADERPLSVRDERLLFRGLHILGGGRDPLAFQPLMRLLSLPIETVEALLGDAITETLGRIITGVFDGDSKRLFAMAADPALDEFVRSALFDAATFLTWDGRIARDAMEAFLLDFDQRRLAEDDDYAWVGWQQAIAVLGFSALAPNAEAAWADGRISDANLRVSDFREDLENAERAPRDQGRLERYNLGYIEDALETLEHWHDWEDPGETAGFDSEWMNEFLPKPALNPFRNVGRNDPCPCQSGKKAKKCCLT